MTPDQNSFSVQQIQNKKARKIVSQCLSQNKLFKKWYLKKSWNTFHSSHYDWWAFPIDEPSSYRDAYQVKTKQIQIMKRCQIFIQALGTNARMVCQAWGYDLENGSQIKKPEEDQKWHNWPIRLYKMTKSLEIFGLQREFQNAIKYGNLLIQSGKKFQYNNRDLSMYFIDKKTKLQENKQKKETQINFQSESIHKIQEKKQNNKPIQKSTKFHANDQNQPQSK